MTKFTKGPWRAVNQFQVIIGSGDSLISSLSTQHTGGLHASVSEREANANLIAAAPDLYEALEDMVRLWEVIAELKGWIPGHVIEYRHAKKILAKVRGKS